MSDDNALARKLLDRTVYQLSGPAPPMTVNWSRLIQANTVISFFVSIGVAGTLFLFYKAGSSFWWVDSVALDANKAGPEACESTIQFFSSHKRAFREFLRYYFFRQQYARVIGLVRFVKDSGHLDPDDADNWFIQLDEILKSEEIFKKYLKACRRQGKFKQAYVVIDYAEERRLKDAAQAQEIRIEVDKAVDVWKKRVRVKGDWIPRFAGNRRDMEAIKASKARAKEEARQREERERDTIEPELNAIGRRYMETEMQCLRQHHDIEGRLRDDQARNFSVNQKYIHQEQQCLNEQTAARQSEIVNKYSNQEQQLLQQQRG